MTIKEYQDKQTQKFKYWWSTRNEKQKRVLQLIPYIIIYMSIITYLAGFLQYREDYYAFIFGAVFLGLFSFILKDKLLKQKK